VEGTGCGRAERRDPCRAGRDLPGGLRQRPERCPPRSSWRGSPVRRCGTLRTRAAQDGSSRRGLLQRPRPGSAPRTCPRRATLKGRLPGAGPPRHDHAGTDQDVVQRTARGQLGHLVEAGGDLFHNPENPGTGAGPSRIHATRYGSRRSLRPVAQAPCAEDLPDLLEAAVRRVSHCR
jgi:hypothetical protein